MERSAIEYEARRLQYEIWQKRALLFKTGIPPLQAMFDPMVAARVLDLDYQFSDYIPAENGDCEAAGLLDRKNNLILISMRFNPLVRKFTGAHENGHFIIHPHLGERIVHREVPLIEAHTSRRPLVEQQADYFAACFLAPRKLVIEEFTKRFGHPPLRLDESVAFHLWGDSASDLFIEPSGSLKFAGAVAAAQKFGGYPFPSLASHFGISVSAMAIRLQELGLVRD